MPWKIQKSDEKWCVHKENADGAIGERVPGGCHDSEAEAERHMKALYANVQETVEPMEVIAEIGLSTPMKKDFMTDVPFAPGLSPEDFVVEEIVGYKDETDESGNPKPIIEKRKPTFVTLQIAEIGRKSDGGIIYDEELVDSIVEQINRKRIGGIFGHVDASKPYEIPEPQVMWVGAKREGNTAWAKAWVRDGKAARWVNDIKRVGGTIGTSIWGFSGKKVKDAVNQAVRLKDFNLQRLDLADDVERASLRMNGAFAVTAEFKVDEHQEEIVDTSTVAEFLSALTPEQIMELLPDAKRTAVSEMVAAKMDLNPSARAVAELRGELDSATSLIAELKYDVEQKDKALAEFRAKEEEATIREALRKATPWNITTEDGKAKYAALHNDILYPAVISELKGGSPLPKAINTVMETKKVSIDMAKYAIAGGGVSGGADNMRTGWYGSEFTDEQRERAKRNTGIRF
jgi:hypothetical protein